MDGKKQPAVDSVTIENPTGSPESDRTKGSKGSIFNGNTLNADIKRAAERLSGGIFGSR